MDDQERLATSEFPSPGRVGIDGELLLPMPSQSRIPHRPNVAPQIYRTLRQARRMAAIEQMAGGIAHDFNNLLQGVFGALDVIRTRIDQGHTDALAQPIEVAYMSLERAADLSRRLLDFSRPHAIEVRPVEVNAVVTTMEPLLKSVLGSRIGLKLVLTEDQCRTNCDPHQLENVLLNLAVNAKDAMPNGGRLVIETFRAEYGYGRTGIRQQLYIGICVADTGIGMTPDVIERAFDPFYTTKPAGRGTGLGLAMTKDFVEQSRGWVNIESVVKKGTAVMLYLPCDSDDDAARGEKMPPSRQ